MKGKYKNKVKKKSLSFRVLKTLGVCGMFVVAASSPGFGLRASYNIDCILKERERKKKWQELYRSLAYLRSKKFVETKELPDKKIEIKITSAGREFIGIADFDNLTIEKPDTWDKRFRLVIFDIPKEKHGASLAFTSKLKELGFFMFQKSVWIHPYDCINEIILLRKIFEIDPYVKVVIVEAFEGDYSMRKHFSLL